jgi:hypothetical protein
MKIWTSGSVSLAEEMVRYMLHRAAHSSFRVIRKSVSAPLLGFNPIRIVDISGTVLTVRGEGQFNGTAVMCKEGGRWTSKFATIEVYGPGWRTLIAYPLLLNPNGIGFRMIRGRVEGEKLAMYHPARLRPRVEVEV